MAPATKKVDRQVWFTPISQTPCFFTLNSPLSDMLIIPNTSRKMTASFGEFVMAVGGISDQGKQA